MYRRALRSDPSHVAALCSLCSLLSQQPEKYRPAARASARVAVHPRRACGRTGQFTRTPPAPEADCSRAAAVRSCLEVAAFTELAMTIAPDHPRVLSLRSSSEDGSHATRQMPRGSGLL
jgi:hypothetical protein